ncbi:MAG: WecB/TagA/CpsF family glycosyltransferase [Chloroflexi bacterium]|nr:WecB/TagA/CpsF family glycosyltransferase [Chloroflexota bacterium]
MSTRITLLDVRIDVVDLWETMQFVREAIASRRPHQIVTVNVDFLKLARGDTGYRHLLNTADLAVADGMPLVWASRLMGMPLPQRITGMDLMLGCAELAAREQRRMFFLGGTEGVAHQAAERLQERFPGLIIGGVYAPPMGSFSPHEHARMVRCIREACPDMLFVAFGAPRQDIWIREHMAELRVPVAVGVGGTFNFLAGRVRRAPVWMQDTGLEWLFRLQQEPKRLWRRYLLQDLPVFFALLAQPNNGEMAGRQRIGPSGQTIRTVSSPSSGRWH